ncbi:hypothetical protein PQR71_16035 [Paraburkholderia fungorum]|uniref:hypothetical protein n=1 Tax=Paraburkholderia fungorum TaxID=134537 RepID=UPI0038B90EBA
MAAQFIRWFALALLPSVSAFADDCTLFNIKDKYQSAFNETTFQLAQGAICKDSVTTSSQAKSAEHSAGISIPIDDIVLGFTYGDKSASNDFSEWKVAFCASHFEEAREHFDEWQVSEYFGANELEAVKACYASKSAYGTYTIDPDGKQFQFEYQPAAGKEKLYRAYIEPASEVSNCNPSNPFDLGPGVGLWGKDISGQVEDVSCSWTGNPVHITLELASQGHPTYNLPKLKAPAIAPILPPPPSPIIVERHTTNNMRWMFSFTDLPEDASCTVIQNNDRWVVGHDGRTAPCPNLIVYDGRPGQPGRADSGPFESKPIDYTDNSGVCAYVFSCLPHKH